MSYYQKRIYYERTVQSTIQNNLTDQPNEKGLVLLKTLFDKLKA
jgi:hypothetical protein